MLKLLRSCAPALNWRTDLVVVGLAVGAFLLADRWLHLGILVGAAPALLLLTCLIPCAVPLAFLRRPAKHKEQQPISNKGKCGC